MGEKPNDRGLEAVARRAPFLSSLRLKVLVVILGVLIMPPFFVFLWSTMERDIEGKLRANVANAAEQAFKELPRASEDDDAPILKPNPGKTAGLQPAMPPSATRLEQKLDAIAVRHVLRIRLLNPAGDVVVDVDRDHGTDLVHQIGTLFLGRDGAPSLQAFDSSLDPLAMRTELQNLAPEESRVGCRKSPARKLLVCHAARRVQLEDGSPAVVYVQESSRRAVRTLYDLRYQLVRLSLVILPIALLLAWWMGTRIVRPIEALRRDALAKASSASPTGQLTTVGPNEVGDLAGAFNTLLTKLEQRRGANERFVADLVHEFKNPVAAIRAGAESLSSGGVDEARAARLSRVLTESSARLDTLVTEFLELARAEAGMPNEERTRVDLSALAKGITESMKVRHPNVHFDTELARSAEVLGVESRLDSAIRNLMENASQFASQGENHEPRVAVSTEISPGSASVRVSDNGSGIRPEDLPRVFDRFFTTRGRERGSGLGLALVKAVVEAHHGKVAVTSRSQEGASFEIVLPRNVDTAR